MATKSTKDTEVKSDEDILALCNQIRQTKKPIQEDHLVNYVPSVAKFLRWV